MSLGAAAFGSSIFQAAGQLMGGLSQGAMYHYQAEVAAMNARIARQNAQYAAGQASTDIEEAGLKAGQRTSGVKAALAANNLDVTTGSPAAVVQSQRMLGNLDTATVASRDARQVYGYTSEEQNYNAQESIDQAASSAAVAGGILGAGGSLLGNAPQLQSAYSWMTANSEPAPGDLTQQETDSMSSEDASTFGMGGG